MFRIFRNYPGISLHRFVLLFSLFLLLGVGGIMAFLTHEQYGYASTRHTATAQTPITHVVIIMMENHTFDSYFGTFPGANGITLAHAANPLRSDYDHSGPATIAAIDNGKMDGFPLPSYVQYVQSDIPTYWAYAKQFGLGDKFFSSMATSSLPNHMAMIAAQTGGIDTTIKNNGCGSIQNTILYSRNQQGNNYWSYPCYGIASLPPILDANNVSWKYYGATGAGSNVQGSINPPVGGVGTAFRFDVVSELPNPTVHTVTIDGTNYSMSLLGPFSSGGYLWEYKTQLPVGTHSYTFTFSDTTGTIHSLSTAYRSLVQRFIRLTLQG